MTQTYNCKIKLKLSTIEWKNLETKFVVLLAFKLKAKLMARLTKFSFYIRPFYGALCLLLIGRNHAITNKW